MNVDDFLLYALEEDVGTGDVTTSALARRSKVVKATVTAKQSFMLAGMPFARRIFELIDESVKFRILAKEGSRVRSGQRLASINGQAQSILIGERTALNILQRLSGIASLTNKFVRMVKGTHVRITDTRKTVPGFRFFEKYAVKIGGGHNHRFGLYDGILIKDNHISLSGSISSAVKRVRSGAHHLLKIEVEAGNIKEVKQAIKAGADVIMLDNMSVEGMKKAVSLIRKSNKDILIEASGNISIENVKAVAETGIDIISVGSITHSAGAVDISLNLD